LNWITNVEGRVATNIPGKGGRSSNIDNREDGAIFAIFAIFATFATFAIVCAGGCAARNRCSKLSGCDSVCSCGLICLPFVKVAMAVLVYVAHNCCQ
jgi:hypothetical protein